MHFAKEFSSRDSKSFGRFKNRRGNDIERSELITCEWPGPESFHDVSRREGRKLEEEKGGGEGE